MSKVIGVGKGLVTGHRPRKTRARIVGADNDEEVQADHDQGAEDTAAVHGSSDVHPPIHVRLGSCVGAKRLASG